MIFLENIWKKIFARLNFSLQFYVHTSKIRSPLSARAEIFRLPAAHMLLIQFPSHRNKPVSVEQICISLHNEHEFQDQDQKANITNPSSLSKEKFTFCTEKQAILQLLMLTLTLFPN